MRSAQSNKRIVLVRYLSVLNFEQSDNICVRTADPHIAKRVDRHHSRSRKIFGKNGDPEARRKLEGHIRRIFGRRLRNVFRQLAGLNLGYIRRRWNEIGDVLAGLRKGGTGAAKIFPTD